MYKIEFDETTGEVSKLICRFDKTNSNAVQQDGYGRFGNLVYTKKSDTGNVVERYAGKGKSLLLQDFYEEFPNPYSTLEYDFADDFFTVKLDCHDASQFGSFGLVLNPNFMDSGENQDFHTQYIPNFPYASKDGKTKFFAMNRPDGIWMLFLPLTVCAGWRIVYDMENPHIFRGFQFLKQFDSRYGGEPAKDGRLVVRISFHSSCEEMLETVYHVTGLNLPRTVSYGEAKDLKDLFFRATDAIREPYHCDFNLCEGAMWLWSLLIRKRLYGSAGKNEYRFQEFLEQNVYITEENVTDADRGKIVSFPHVYGRKQYSAYHLYKLNRIQNAVTQGEIMLEAWRAYQNPEYLRLSKEYLDNLIRDHLSEGGALVCDSCGDVGIDYSTVTACIFGFVDLYRELIARNDADAEKFRDASILMANHLVRRGLNFPTEGTCGRKEMEEGSISCTALSLLYAYRFVEKNPKYLEFAKELLVLHDAWCMRVPDARMFGSTVRWWEANWEGDADGSSINAGHAWTIWKAEADYHYAYLTGNFERLIRSYNGYMTNFEKVREDGRMYTCYTPDYLPSKPYKIRHGYPDMTDGSMPYYVWTRCPETWFVTSALYSDEAGVHCLNGWIIDGEVKEMVPSGPALKYLFVRKITEPIVIQSEDVIEVIYQNGTRKMVKPLAGKIYITSTKQDECAND